MVTDIRVMIIAISEAVEGLENENNNRMAGTALRDYSRTGIVADPRIRIFVQTVWHVAATARGGHT